MVNCPCKTKRRKELNLSIEELKEQLQINICMYVDETNAFEGFGENDIKDSLCQVVIDTFNNAFFAPAPADLTDVTTL